MDTSRTQQIAAKMNSIVYRFPKKHFVNVALPHLVEKCPSLEFHFVFINSPTKEFEDVCCLARRVLDIDCEFDIVCVYGSTVRAVRECVDVLLEGGYRDRTAMMCDE
jgi:hypothetical protein